MKRLSMPGMVYGDCSPAGEWVCSIVGKPAVLTSWQGEIPAPAELMFNRLHGRMIAAKTQSPGNVAVFDGQWFDMNIDSPGVQGHAWDDAGNLAILQAGADQESMGLQFYDPSITSPHASLDRFRTTPGFVTGSAAYSPSSPLSRELGIDRLFLWTKRGDIAIGQGDSGGTAIQYQGVHYLLEPGDSRFVQFHRDGDQLAIAITRFQQGDVVCRWLNVADIPRLARYGAPQPDPIPEPEPTPDPEPDPMTKRLPDDVFETFRRVCEKFPHTADDAQRRDSMRKAIGTIRAIHGTRYVTKTEHRSGWDAQSTDAICEIEQGVTPVHGERQNLYIWDAVNGGTFQPEHPGESEELRPAYVLIPETKNWLDGDAPPLPSPPHPDGKHAYYREDNDRDECSVVLANGKQCDEPKAADIHQGVTAPPTQPPTQPPTLPPGSSQLDRIEHKLDRLLARRLVWSE
jgi:hypothetical protein